MPAEWSHAAAFELQLEKVPGEGASVAERAGSAVAQLAGPDPELVAAVVVAEQAGVGDGLAPR
jgi:hypothetical protein